MLRGLWNDDILVGEFFYLLIKKFKIEELLYFCFVFEFYIVLGLIVVKLVFYDW